VCFRAIALIELAKAGWVEDIAVTGRCWPVLIHQILALALAGSVISVADSWEHLSRVVRFPPDHTRRVRPAAALDARVRVANSDIRPSRTGDRKQSGGLAGRISWSAMRFCLVRKATQYRQLGASRWGP